MQGCICVLNILECVLSFIRENKLQDKIILIKEEIEQLQLPVEKVCSRV